VSFNHKKSVNVKICNKKYFSKISQDKHNLKECDTTVDTWKLKNKNKALRVKQQQIKPHYKTSIK